MRGLTEKNGGSSRSISTCSFCRSPNHQVGKCPHVPIIKKSLDKGIIPLKYMATIAPNDTSGQSSSWRQSSSYWRSPLASYYTNGEHWGDLYKQTYRAFAKWERAQAKAKNKAKNKGKKRTQKCGYCGGNHTRRTCGLLASHKTKLAKANRNFRKWFYQKYVVEQGLSTGAIVDIDVQIQGGYNRPAQDKTIRTLVTEINWDTINLFATKEKADKGWNRISQYTGEGGDEKLSNIENFIHSGAYLKVPKKVFEDNGVQTYHYYHDNNGTYSAVPLSLKPAHRPKICPWEIKREPYSGTAVRGVTIVSRAPQVLADDWVDGYADEMAVIFKKFSFAQLDFLGVIDHIKEWEKKEI